MAEIKTTKNATSVTDFLANVSDEQRQSDAHTICAIMTAATGEQPAMWGSSIVGFGSFRYASASGRKGEYLALGFSPRKASLTVYIMDGFEPYGDLMARLGTFTTGKSCLYIKKLADVDQEVLRDLITTSFNKINGKTLRT